MSYVPPGAPNQRKEPEKGRIAAIIGTVAAIATILTFILTHPWDRSPSSPTPLGSTSPSTPLGSTSPPRVSGSTSPQTAPQSNAKPTPRAIPLLIPIINQPGWALAWHQNVSIDPQGIILGAAGPQIGDGNEYDLQYIPGS